MSVRGQKRGSSAGMSAWCHFAAWRNCSVRSLSVSLTTRLQNLAFVIYRSPEAMRQYRTSDPRSECIHQS